MFAGGRYSNSVGGCCNKAMAKEKLPSPMRSMLSNALKGIVDCRGTRVLAMCFPPAPFARLLKASVAASSACFFFLSRDCADERAALSDAFLLLLLLLAMTPGDNTVKQIKCCLARPQTHTHRHPRTVTFISPDRTPLLLSVSLFISSPWSALSRASIVFVLHALTQPIVDLTRYPPKERPIRRQSSRWQKPSKYISQGETSKTVAYRPLGSRPGPVCCCRWRCARCSVRPAQLTLLGHSQFFSRPLDLSSFEYSYIHIPRPSLRHICISGSARTQCLCLACQPCKILAPLAK